MRKVLCLVLVIMFLISSVGFAQPAWKQAGELPPGLAKQAGKVPPGLQRQADVAQPSTLTVTFDDGAVFVVEGMPEGQTVKFAVTYTGIVVSAVAEQNGRFTEWVGNGEEYADMSAYDEATWQWVWTSGGAKGRGRQVLTIGYADGIIYEVEEPVEEEPIEEPIEEEPIIDEPIEEEPVEEE